MKELVTTMTERGQVTVPAEVRRLLGLRPKDKVAFTIDDGVVRIKPVEFTVQSAYRSIKPLVRGLDTEEMICEAMEEWAEEQAEKTMRMLREQ